VCVFVCVCVCARVCVCVCARVCVYIYILVSLNNSLSYFRPAHHLNQENFAIFDSKLESKFKALDTLQTRLETKLSSLSSVESKLDRLMSMVSQKSKRLGDSPFDDL